MAAGRIRSERFDKLSAQYEEEQVRQVIGELQSLIGDGGQEALDLRQFLKNVRKYTAPEELTASAKPGTAEVNGVKIENWPEKAQDCDLLQSQSCGT